MMNGLLSGGDHRRQHLCVRKRALLCGGGNSWQNGMMGRSEFVIRAVVFSLSARLGMILLSGQDRLMV